MTAIPIRVAVGLWCNRPARWDPHQHICGECSHKKCCAVVCLAQWHAMYAYAGRCMVLVTSQQLPLYPTRPVGLPRCMPGLVCSREGLLCGADQSIVCRRCASSSELCTWVCCPALHIVHAYAVLAWPPCQHADGMQWCSMAESCLAEAVCELSP